ncbi:response regulator [Methylocella silvestris]|uniref:Two-component system response regulator n=1 Tax=Methylocella silvestris TaxID=199596 RepID=A0A2J7TE72_METSI|nr:response regulator [Methylocella silvestris]PNG25065.1 two-component system response regulator [Methylocella silvestris]
MSTILTVDDSASIRTMIKVTLGPAGHTIVEAADGEEGLARAKSQKIDLVITDLNMPRMNGLAMIKALRAAAACVGVPIVFLTTESDPAMKQEAKAAGATGWLTKPFNADQLLSIVNKLVRK